MGASAFTFWDGEVIPTPTSPALVPGVRTLLATAPEISNTDGKPALSVVITYDSVTPDVIIPPWYLSVLVEGQDAAGNWKTIARQFTDFRHSGQGTERPVIMHPNLSTFDTGFDDVEFSADEIIGRISRQQGTLPATKFRARLFIKDNDPTGTHRFVSVTLSAHGERQDV